MLQNVATMKARVIPGTGLILVLGIHGRTGTYFTRNLLGVHREIGVSQLAEDFLIADASILSAYVLKVAVHWALHPPSETKHRSDQLRRSLGHALADHIRGEGATRYIVSRTPRVRGLEYVAEFLPGAKVVVTVRDGRDVVESGRRSFGWDFVETARAWATGVNHVLGLRNQQKVALVKFEDLVTDLEGALRPLFDFLHVDAESYDFVTARQVPVVGSCETREDSNVLHWRPVPKSVGFNPIGRWKNWTAKECDQFTAIAGEAMESVGYKNGF